MRPGVVNETMYRGCAFSRTYELRDIDNQPLVLSGWTADGGWAAVKGGARLGTYTTSIDPLVGLVTISRTKAQNEAVALGNFHHNLVMTPPSGETIEPAFIGTLTIEPTT